MKRALAIAAIIGAASTANAQAKGDYAADEQVKKGIEEVATAKGGWNFGLELGSNASFSHSSSTVGQPDGSTIQLGGVLNGNANLIAGDHEWKNSLTYNTTWSQSPTIGSFLKTADNLELKSTYLYALPAVPWLGPYARARLQTQVFDGWQRYAADRVVTGDLPDQSNLINERTNAETNLQEADLPAGEALNLTTGFEPLNLRQSVGAFARPWNTPAFAGTFSLGLGAQEVYTDGGYVVTKDEGLPNSIETAALKDSTQAGAELELEFKGSAKKMFTWSASANFLQPFVTNTDIDPEGNKLEGMDLMNIEFAAKASVKLASWASLDYVLTAKKLPLVLNEWQIQNGLLLSSSFKLL
jgi:hypothetical protein